MAACDTACKVRDRTGRCCLVAPGDRFQLRAGALVVPSCCQHVLGQGPAAARVQDMLGTDVLVAVQAPAAQQMSLSQLCWGLPGVRTLQ